nr:transposase family protein [Desulfobacterales bacterium]
RSSDLVSQISKLTGKSVQYTHKRLKGVPCDHIKGRGKPQKKYLLEDLPADIQNLYLEPLDLRRFETKDSSNLPALTSKNLPVAKNLSPVRLPESLNDILNQAPITQDKDDWLSRPETCRNKGIESLRIVNTIREIRAGSQNIVEAFVRYADSLGCSVATLYRMEAKADKAKAAARKNNEDAILAQIKALTPKYGQNKNKLRAWSREAAKFAVNLYMDQRNLNVSTVYREATNTALVEGWKTGSYDSLNNIIRRRINKSTQHLARKGKRSWEAAYQTKILRDYTEIGPNFMWCGDHHIFDVFVRVPDGKGGWVPMRPLITAWMDMKSRSIMGWVISFQPNSQCIAEALAHAIADKNDPNFPQHGLPASVYVDNGKDYQSKRLNGEEIKIGQIDYPEIIEKYRPFGIDLFYIDLKYDEKQDCWVKKRGQKEHVIKGVRWGGVYAVLGVGCRRAIVYHPWSKSIERFFRIVAGNFSRLLPGWCGTNPQERPEKLKAELKAITPLLTIEEFCNRWYDWVTNVYHKTPHRGHGMNGRTPDQIFTSELPNPEVVDPMLLDFALQKKARVKIHPWGFYLNGKEFEPVLPPTLYGGHLANELIGEWASILFDINYRTVRIYKSGKYICDAKPLERASFLPENDRVMVEKIKAQQYQAKAAKAIIRAISQKASEIPMSTDEALLRLTHGEQVSDEASSVDVLEQPPTANEQYVEEISIYPRERYAKILEAIARGDALSQDTQAFKDEFEQSSEYRQDVEKWTVDLEMLKYQHNKRMAAR